MTYEEIFSFVEKNLKKTAARKMENHLAVEFDIYGEGEGAFYVEVKDGVISASPYEYYDHNAKVIVTADELVKLIKGEKNIEDSLSEGRLGIEGNIDDAREIIALIKAPVKRETTAKRTVKAEKTIVENTKKKDSKVAKDIKK